MAESGGAQGVGRRYGPADLEQRREFRDGSRIKVPVVIERSRDSAGCPAAILDTDPEGHGLGVWVLVAEHPDEEHSCEYEYAGGIA